MTDENAVKNSLINLFSTMRGSRRMIPQFGTSLYNYLFEQLDDTTAYAIGNELYSVVQM
jgi:phage baseplate assembly protein W